MVARLGRRPLRVQRLEFPQELLEQRYAVIRDEMLWREYASLMTRGDPEGVRRALSVLRVLRETSE